MTVELSPTNINRISSSGFEFIEECPISDVMPPVLVASFVTHLRSSRRKGFLVGHQNPNLTEEFNQKWFAAAGDFGLFSAGDRGCQEFLVGVDTAREWSLDELIDDEVEHVQRCRWARIALLRNWDIAGSGCESGFLGAGRNNPTFTMMSLDGSVIFGAAYWQNGIGCAMVRDPESVSEFHEHARRIASYDHVESRHREWASQWLVRASRHPNQT